MPRKSTADSGRSVALVITSCTNRKRRAASLRLQIQNLDPATMAELAGDWASRLIEEKELFLPGEIYSGRGFREAERAASALNADMAIISAGLGLVSASTKVPAYASTILTDLPDSIAGRVEGSFAAPDWWKALKNISPFDVALSDMLAAQEGLILAASSGPYLNMVSAELSALPPHMLARLRLFTRTPTERINPALASFVMPYDDRLDGPDSAIRGTRSDFAPRAMRHFAEFIVGTGGVSSVSAHASEVLSFMRKWRLPTKIERVRHADEELLRLMRAHWDDNERVSLRRFRDDFNIACEQKRFSSLANIVRAERALSCVKS